MATRRTVTLFTAFGHRECGDIHEADVFDALHDQLRDPVAPVDPDGLVPIVVDEHDLDLTAIACVDGSRRVDDREAVAQRQTRPRVNEGGEARGQGDRDARRHQCPLTGRDGDVDRRDQIGTGITGARIPGKLDVGVKTLDLHVCAHVARPYPRRIRSLRHSGGVNAEHHERLTAPLTWWFVAIAAGALIGWLVRVATTVEIGFVVAVTAAAIAVAFVACYGAVRVQASPAGLRAGRAWLDGEHVGAVEPLDAEGWARALGPEGDLRAFTVTRPYIRTGVRVTVDDPADPTPFWLVSTRFPATVARALGHGS